MSEAEGYVRVQEQKEARRLSYMFVLLFALMAALFGASTLYEFDELSERLAWSWDGARAAGQFAQPVVFALLAIKEYKSGVHQYD